MRVSSRGDPSAGGGAALPQGEGRWSGISTTTSTGTWPMGWRRRARSISARAVPVLNLAEAAMLTARPQFPALNPIGAPEDAKRRQGITLQAMVDAGYITAQEAEAAFQQELNLRRSVTERFDILTAPHFALYVLDQVKRGVQRGGRSLFHLEEGADDLHHAGCGAAASCRADSASRSLCWMSRARTPAMPLWL